MGVMRRRLASRVARGILLVALALGLYGMHTLGHLDGRHGCSASHAHGMGMGGEPLPVALQAFVPEREMPGFDPTSVCLAVLTSLMVLLLIGAWTVARRPVGEGGREQSPAGRVARPPPKPTRLTLASLSILRI